jgi:hypothetical protein
VIWSDVAVVPTASRLRLALATALLSLGVVVPVLASPGPALATGASQCQQQPVATLTRQAGAVFVGTVASATSTALTDGRQGVSYSQSVQVSTVYKGRITEPEVVVVTERVRRECSVGALTAGTTYMYFVQSDGDAAWRAEGGGGTAPADATLVGQVTRLLGSGRPPVAPERESATFTTVDVDEPARLSRVAAPGAALVLVGLLGLLVAGRLGRRA